MRPKIRPLTLSVFFILTLFLTSCLKDKVDVKQEFYTPEEYATLSAVVNLPSVPVNYQVQLPHHMVVNNAKAPVINSHKAALGRVLFYDKKLSQNKTVSCASCHRQELAFSDDKAFSEGFNGEHTHRNSLPLAAAANFESSYGGGNGGFGIPFEQVGFFWDDRAANIMEQSRLTIQDNIEMGMPLYQLVDRLRTEPYYQVLFKKAYGSNDSEITQEKILESIQEFLNSFISVQSRFDKGLDRVGDPEADFDIFTAQENLGKSLFMKNCASCHTRDMSIAVKTLANNGLDMNYTDKGRGDITNNPGDEGRFKVPFLRNIALTGPYMHDGRFNSLEEVIEHYNSGIQDHPNLDLELKDPFTLATPKRLHLTDAQKQALIAFLNTLTDEEFVVNSKFSDPFKY